MPDSSFHGIPQARILEWVAIPFPREVSDPGIEPRSPALQVILYHLNHQGSPLDAQRAPQIQHVQYGTWGSLSPNHAVPNQFHESQTKGSCLMSSTPCMSNLPPSPVDFPSQQLVDQKHINAPFVTERYLPETF